MANPTAINIWKYDAGELSASMVSYEVISKKLYLIHVFCLLTFLSCWKVSAQ